MGHCLRVRLSLSVRGLTRGSAAPIGTCFTNAGSSASGPSPMPTMSRSTAKPARAMPASSGSKARTMSSWTATSCISGLRISRVHPPWSRSLRTQARHLLPAASRMALKPVGLAVLTRINSTVLSFSGCNGRRKLLNPKTFREAPICCCEDVDDPLYLSHSTQ